MLGEAAEDKPFGVWAENETIFNVFTTCSAQWHFIEGHRIGMIYSEVLAVMDIYNTDNRQEVFEGVLVMERAALEALG